MYLSEYDYNRLRNVCKVLNDILKDNECDKTHTDRYPESTHGTDDTTKYYDDPRFSHYTS